MSLGVWFIAFCSMLLLDVAWVLYIDAVDKRMPGKGSLWAGAIHGFGATATLSYTGNTNYLSATMLGTVVGTWAIIRWKKYKDECEATQRRLDGASIPRTSPQVMP